MKHNIIIGATCFIIGASAGVGGVFYFQHKKSNALENSTTVIHVSGEKDKIKHTSIKNKKETVELTTVSTGKETIRTIIKKKDFCPKVYKNSVSAIVYAGMYEFQPTISYGIEYRRQIFSRFHVLTGLKIDTSVYMVNGFQVYIGAGVNL